MQKVPELLIFCFVGGLVAPLASGFLAGLYLSTDTWQSFPMLWLKWTSSDGLGVLLLSPAVMVMIDLIRRGPKSGGQNALLVINKNRCRATIGRIREPRSSAS